MAFYVYLLKYILHETGEAGYEKKKKNLNLSYLIFIFYILKKGFRLQSTNYEPQHPCSQNIAPPWISFWMLKGLLLYITFNRSSVVLLAMFHICFSWREFYHSEEGRGVWSVREGGGELALLGHHETLNLKPSGRREHFETLGPSLNSSPIVCIR